MVEPLLRVHDLKMHFPAGRGILGRKPGRAIRAVDGVSFQLAPGETLGLVGESGCGKTTTGRMVMRLLDPTSGRIDFEGKDIAALSQSALRPLRRHFQMIAQDPYGSLDPRMTVETLIGEPMVIAGFTGERIRARVLDLLGRVGLAASQGRRYPHEFSGGQRQRIAIARALALEPKLVVCDEPVSALDVSVQAQIINLMRDLQVELGLSYLFIGHDLSVVRHISDHVAVMYLGRIVESAPKRQLFDRPRHPYTQALLSAVPVPRPNALRRRIVLAGDVPSPADPPPGCHFHTRCPYAQQICRETAPALTASSDRHAVACHFSDTLSAGT
jgi:oligopeptide/dipeptide ABC transporter ATP-binding protein